ncbi:MAG: HIG1 domain-containing protein [Gammaproteobacteria bacterium]|nr:HIG1 domain-containing protein [Gammaproteobacteria bacterium]MDH3450727.1 HIG1 domain-containing protein [Gammaproteobacteria bacterium]
MSLLNMVIIAALVTTIAVMATGLWSMSHGGEFDEKHGTQLMAARVGMQAVTLLLLLFAFFLAS